MRNCSLKRRIVCFMNAIIKSTNRRVEDEDFTREMISAIENIYCEEELLLEDSVPEDYSRMEDLGVRSQEIQIHIPEDINGVYLSVCLSVFLLSFVSFTLDVKLVSFTLDV